MASKIFESVKFSTPPKSAFDLSHNKKLSFNFGELVPVYRQEILPGDQFRVSTNLLIRLAPMPTAPMVEFEATLHYFFVPNRIIWNDWEDFITGGDPDIADPVMPLFTDDELIDGTLYDYMGLTTTEVAGGFNFDLSFNALPFRAYYKIWNEYYRDQNLQDEIDYENLTAAYGTSKGCLLRNYAKDYFTSAFTEPQKGEPVSLALNDIIYSQTGLVVDSAGATATSSGSIDHTAAGVLQIQGGTNQQTGNIENIDSIGMDVIELRRAAALQRFLEKDQLGGNRYREHLRVHYGVNNDDLRMQVPQYIGGGKQPVIISEVLNTTHNNNTDAIVGQIYGHGISVGNINSFQESFKEHGIILGLLSVMPKNLVYADGIPKDFLRTDRFDYYFPEFANIGEQEIKEIEVYNGDLGTFDPTDDEGTGMDTWGYQQKFAEYKYACDTVHGEFKNPAKLGAWTFKRDYLHFAGAPTLSSEFIECDHDEIDDQIFYAANTDHKIFCELQNIVQARRPMPYFADYRLS